MSERSKTITTTIVSSLLCSAVTGSIVYGITMSAFVTEIHADTQDIKYLKEADAAIRMEYSEERKRNDQRIFEAVDLMKRHLTISERLLAHIEVQDRIKQ